MLNASSIPPPLSLSLVRRHPNPWQLIPSILHSNPQAYKNTSKVTISSSPAIETIDRFQLISLALHLPLAEQWKRKERCMLFIAEYCLQVNNLSRVMSHLSFCVRAEDQRCSHVP